MKKFFLFLVITAAVCMAGKAQENAMVAYFDAANPVIMPLDNYTVSVFGLKASPEQMEQVASMAAEFPKKYAFSSEMATDKEYDYTCTLVFLLAEGIPYLHKTLLTFGIMHFQYNGTVYDINEMISVLR
jgi:hypothetical protein